MTSRLLVAVHPNLEGPGRPREQGAEHGGRAVGVLAPEAEDVVVARARAPRRWRTGSRRRCSAPCPCGPCPCRAVAGVEPRRDADLLLAPDRVLLAPSDRGPAQDLLLPDGAGAPSRSRRTLARHEQGLGPRVGRLDPLGAARPLDPDVHEEDAVVVGPHGNHQRGLLSCLRQVWFLSGRQQPPERRVRGLRRASADREGDADHGGASQNEGAGLSRRDMLFYWLL